jgi:hypothetical protein
MRSVVAWRHAPRRSETMNWMETAMDGGNDVANQGDVSQPPLPAGFVVSGSLTAPPGFVSSRIKTPPGFVSSRIKTTFVIYA